MAKSLFYTLFLSGVNAFAAYEKCVEQGLFTKEELEEILSIAKEL